VKLFRTSSARGSAIVELALALPLLVLILVGTIDFARAFHTAMVLQNSARAGAQYGAQSTSFASNTSGMISTAKTSASTDLGAIDATAEETCYCASNTDPNVGNPSPNTCAGTCTTGHLVVSVKVTAGASFSTITRFPGIPHTFRISRGATLRAQ